MVIAAAINNFTLGCKELIIQFHNHNCESAQHYSWLLLIINSTLSALSLVISTHIGVKYAIY